MIIPKDPLRLHPPRFYPYPSLPRPAPKGFVSSGAIPPCTADPESWEHEYAARFCNYDPITKGECLQIALQDPHFEHPQEQEGLPS